jgi:hypothetical protein
MFTTNGITPPVITEFNCACLGSNTWQITGTVTDTSEPVEGMKVNLGGVLADYHLEATVESNGTFKVIKMMPFVQAGVATAQAEDKHGNKSNTEDGYVDAPCGVPNVNFTIIQERNGRYILSGFVSDGAFVSGQKVVFGGVAASYNLSAPVNPDGSFAISFYAPGLQHGDITAQVVDPNGTKGNVGEINWE